MDAVDDSELCNAKISGVEDIIKELKDKENENNSKDFKTIQSEIQKKDEVINMLRGDKLKLEEALDVAENNWKELNKLSKVKDKEVHNLKKKEKE